MKNFALEEHIEMTAMAYDIDRDEAMNRAMPLLRKHSIKINESFSESFF